GLERRPHRRMAHALDGLGRRAERLHRERRSIPPPTLSEQRGKLLPVGLHRGAAALLDLERWLVDRQLRDGKTARRRREPKGTPRGHPEHVGTPAGRVDEG